MTLGLTMSANDWSSSRARPAAERPRIVMLAMSVLVLAVACGGGGGAVPVMDTEEAGSDGMSTGFGSGDSGLADSSGGSSDESSTGEEPEYGPSYAVMFSGGPSLPVVQVADVTDPDVTPELHTLVERSASGETNRGILQGERWSVYAIVNGADYRLFLHDLVDHPLGPLIEVGGLEPGSLSFQMDEAESLLAVTVSPALAGTPGYGYLVDLDGDPSTAVPVPGTPDEVFVRLSPGGD